MSRLLVLPILALAACTSISARLVEGKKHEYRADGRLTQHTVNVAGHDVVYLDRGAGEPMVLLHGFATDKDNWTLFAKWIPDTHRVIALDLPGFGESSQIASERYDIGAQSARLLAFVDALGLTTFELGGNSMGGHIAARFTIQHPERVKSLFLVDAGGVVSPRMSEVGKEIAAGRNPLVVESVEDFDRFMKLGFVKPPDIPGFIKTYFAEKAVEHRPFNEKIFADFGRTPDHLDADLGKITAPTLVLWGDKDLILDVSAASVFQTGIPRAQTVLIADCGHAPMVERPEETAQKYLAFLAGAGAATTK